MIVPSVQNVSLAQLPDFCEKLLKKFSNRQLVLLDGPLGAGKTQFVKECVLLLGGEMPDSPTFSVINHYKSPKHAIYHIDLYRLDSEEDIESTGFWDLFREEQALIFVEWANKIPSADWPKSWPQYQIKITPTENANIKRYAVTFT